MELKNIVSENLLDVKYRKNDLNIAKKKLMELKKFSQEHIFESKREREIFAGKVFNELLNLDRDNFLNETELESWSGFPKWVWDTMKEKVIRFFVKKVAPSKADSFAANVIVTGLGDIDLKEIGKMGDCDFVTRKLANAIVEGSLETVKRKMGFDDSITDVIRNALAETIEQSEFSQKLQTNLASVVCPAVRKVSSAFSSAKQ